MKGLVDRELLTCKTPNKVVLGSSRTMALVMLLIALNTSNHPVILWVVKGR